MPTGNPLEPIEKLFVEVPQESMGAIMENLAGAQGVRSPTWTITATR